MKKDWFLTAEEALNLGILTEIIWRSWKKKGAAVLPILPIDLLVMCEDG
jgi:hypothetical protein